MFYKINNRAISVGIWFMPGFIDYTETSGKVEHENTIQMCRKLHKFAFIGWSLKETQPWTYTWSHILCGILYGLMPSGKNTHTW